MKIRVVCGNTIGKYAFIGAVVVSDVAAHAHMVGNPARRIGSMCACGEKLKFEGAVATCSVCNDRYRQKGANEIARE